jgi:hypothetical protein
MDIVFHSLAATKGRINDRSFVDDAELAENLPIVSCSEVLAFFAGRRRESVGCSCRTTDGDPESVDIAASTLVLIQPSWCGLASDSLAT